MVPAIGYGAIGSNHAARFFPNLNGLGVVAWSDSCPPGIQTVAGLILWSGKTFFFVEIHFYCHPLIQVGQLLVTGEKDVHLVLVNRLGLSLPRKSVVRLTDHPDMTIVVDWDIKPQIKLTNNQGVNT